MKLWLKASICSLFILFFLALFNIAEKMELPKTGQYVLITGSIVGLIGSLGVLFPILYQLTRRETLIEEREKAERVYNEEFTRRLFDIGTRPRYTEDDIMELVNEFRDRSGMARAFYRTNPVSMSRKIIRHYRRSEVKDVIKDFEKRGAFYKSVPDMVRHLHDHGELSQEYFEVFEEETDVPTKSKITKIEKQY